VRGHVRVRHETDSPWGTLEAVTCPSTPNSYANRFLSSALFSPPGNNEHDHAKCRQHPRCSEPTSENFGTVMKIGFHVACHTYEERKQGGVEKDHADTFLIVDGNFHRRVF